MENRFRCSVVIPTRNCLRFLPQALGSISMQGIKDLEILVVDDGSSDGTWDWLTEEARSDSRLVPIRGAGNGPSLARNAALSLARAPLIAFLDADDFWWPDKLSRQLAYHESHPETGFSFTDYLHFDACGQLRGTCFDYWAPSYINRKSGDYAPVPDAEFELLAANVVGTSTVVASLELLQNANGFAPNSQSAEDWRLWLDLAARAPVAASAAVTTSYLMHPASATANRDARIESMREIVAPFRSRREPAARRSLRRADARIAIAEAERARELGDKWGALRGHWRAFASWPQRRTARALAADLAALPFSTRKK
jgi:glycosyltransferase involved in cell wall biosynthesis